VNDEKVKKEKVFKDGRREEEKNGCGWMEAEGG
jgi:hypothetical protein